MALWTLDVQYFYWLPDGETRYYWTNCYAWLQDDALTVPDSAVVTPLQLATIALAKQNTTRQLYRIRNRPMTYQHIFVDNAVGGYPGFASDGLLDYCVLLHGYNASGSQIAYKRLRGVWSQSEMDARTWKPALVSYLQAYVDGHFPGLPLCNWGGRSVSSWRVDSAIHIWQQRHGTKRRARPVIAL